MNIVNTINSIHPTFVLDIMIAMLLEDAAICHERVILLFQQPTFQKFARHQ